jgi:hypothetical protein
MEINLLGNVNKPKAGARNRAFPPLISETRYSVGTATAAFWVLREQQTLRSWACHQSGPIQPIRVHGRLAWPVSEIKRLMGVPE